MSIPTPDFDFYPKSYSDEAQGIIKATETLHKNDLHQQVKALIAQEKARKPEVMQDLFEHCLTIIQLEVNPFRTEGLSKKQKAELFASWAGYAEVVCRKLVPFVDKFIGYLKGSDTANSYSTAMRIQNKVLTVRETFGSRTSKEYRAALEKHTEIIRALEATLKEKGNNQEDEVSEIEYFNEHGRDIVSQLLRQLYDEVAPAISRNEGSAPQFDDGKVDGLVVKFDYKNAAFKLPLKPSAKRRKKSMVELRIEYQYRQTAENDNKITKVNGKEEFVAFVLRAFENRLKTEDSPYDTFAKVLVVGSYFYSIPYRIEMLLTDEMFPTLTDRFITVRLRLETSNYKETSES